MERTDPNSFLAEQCTSHSKDTPRPNTRHQGSSTDHQSDIDELYQNYSSELSAYLRKTFGDGPPDPDDIAQEAFSRLLQQESLERVKNLKAFLWRTARNLVLTDKRNTATRSKYDFEIEHLFFAARGADDGPERVLEVNEQLDIVRKVLKKTTPRHRRAFLWHRVEGLSFTDIGRRLGVNRRAAARYVVGVAVDLEAALRQSMERTD